jgi:lysophospholipase L1-like esterase
LLQNQNGLMKSAQWAVFLLVLVASNLATGYVVKKNARPKVDYQRDMAESLAKMNSANGPFIVMIGDSLTQNRHLPASICGIPLINAGIDGSRASTFIPFAEEMTALKLSPALVVIALGINDAVSAYRTDFKASYGLLIDSLPQSPISLATLAPVDPNLPLAKRLNPSTIRSIDATIMEIAASRGAPIIDLGAIAGMETRDGIHPTDRTYHLWIAAVVAGIQRDLKCDAR